MYGIIMGANKHYISNMTTIITTFTSSKDLASTKASQSTQQVLPSGSQRAKRFTTLEGL